RNGIRQAQGPFASPSHPDNRCPLASNRRHLRAVLASRVHELLHRRRIWIHLRVRLVAVSPSQRHATPLKAFSSLLEAPDLECSFRSCFAAGLAWPCRRELRWSVAHSAKQAFPSI